MSGKLFVFWDLNKVFHIWMIFTNDNNQIYEWRMIDRDNKEKFFFVTKKK